MRTRVRCGIRRLAILTLVLVVLAPAGTAAAQGKPIRIGEINSYSGLATVYTFPYKEGLLMAAKEINDAGGVLGRPIEFIFRDDKLKPDEAITSTANEDEIDLPRGLLEAVDLFENDKDLREVLGEPFVSTYAAIKRAEFETFMEVISPWEREYLLLNV